MTPLWPDGGQLWAEAQRFGEDGVPGGERVRVLRRQMQQRAGSTKPQLGDWSSARAHEVDGVGLDRMASSSLGGDVGNGELQTSMIYFPTHGDIERGDRIYFASGVVVEVDGIPNRQPNMINGWSPPASAAVKVTHG